MSLTKKHSSQVSPITQKTEIRESNQELSETSNHLIFCQHPLLAQRGALFDFQILWHDPVTLLGV